MSSPLFPSLLREAEQKRIQLQNQNQCFPRFKLIEEPGNSVVGQGGKNIPLLMRSSLRFAS